MAGSTSRGSWPGRPSCRRSWRRPRPGSASQARREIAPGPRSPLAPRPPPRRPRCLAQPALVEPNAGAAGFIGSRIVARLLAAGHTVHATRRAAGDDEGAIAALQAGGGRCWVRVPQACIPKAVHCHAQRFTPMHPRRSCRARPSGCAGLRPTCSRRAALTLPPRGAGDCPDLCVLQWPFCSPSAVAAPLCQSPPSLCPASPCAHTQIPCARGGGGQPVGAPPPRLAPGHRAGAAGGGERACGRQPHAQRGEGWVAGGRAVREPGRQGVRRSCGSCTAPNTLLHTLYRASPSPFSPTLRPQWCSPPRWRR